MKLVALVFASLLAIPVAHAEDVLNPPGGPVYAENTAAAPPQRQMKNRALRMALMQQFDRDGDGRLNPRERMHAARVLGRIQEKLAGKGMRQRGEVRARGEGRAQRREMRRLRREQRGMHRDRRDAPQDDAQVDIYVR